MHSRTFHGAKICQNEWHAAAIVARGIAYWLGRLLNSATCIVKLESLPKKGSSTLCGFGACVALIVARNVSERSAPDAAHSALVLRSVWSRMV